MTTRREHTQWTDGLLFALACLGIGCLFAGLTLPERVEALIGALVYFLTGVLCWKHGHAKGHGQGLQEGLAQHPAHDFLRYGLSVQRISFDELYKPTNERSET